MSPTIPPPSEARRSDEPHDPITEAANEGLDAVRRRLELAGYRDAQIIVMVDCKAPEPGRPNLIRSGMGFTPFDDDVEAAQARDQGKIHGAVLMAALLTHARAVARASGKDLDMLFVGDEGPPQG